MSKTLIIIDGEQPRDIVSGTVVYWSSFSENPDHYSLPQLVDECGDELKQWYLDWVYQLGLKKYQGKTLREHLQLRDNFSFWWMTLLQEKSAYKSPTLYTVFRCRALELLYKKLNCKKLVLYTTDSKLQGYIKAMALNLTAKFEFHKVSSSKRNVLLAKAIRQRLPKPLRAILFYGRFLYRAAPFIFSRKRKEDLKQENNDRINIVSYFPNIDMQAAENGQFFSYYWGELHKTLDSFSKGINWYFIYSPHPKCSLRTAIRLCNRFNHEYKGKQRFLFLEECLAFSNIIGIVRDYVRLVCKAWKLRKIDTLFSVANSSVPLGMLFKNDWRESLIGACAIDGCIWLAKFQGMCDMLGPQYMALYIMEGQAWEKALLYAWKEKQSAKIVGNCHAIVRFFDFRYFNYGRLYEEQGQSFLNALPDKIAVNGLQPLRVMRESGVPEAKLILVEAIRYLYLNHFQHLQARETTTQKTLLCITDYFASSTRFQLKVLCELLTMPEYSKLKVIVKPHPYFPINNMLQLLQLSGKIEISNDHLSVLWGKVDLVFTSNLTTTPLEVIKVGLPCMIAKDPEFFNFSPLRAVSEVVFVENATELSQAVKQSKIYPHQLDYFDLDDKLPKWRKLLGVA